MTDHNQDIPLPEQREGTEKNIETTVEATDVVEAKSLFEKAKSNLLNVNRWHELCGPLSAVFQLTNDKGENLEGTAAVDAFFKIDIPGPGTTAGQGFDWVRVEAIEEEKDEQADTEFVLVRVRPTDNPCTENKNIAHFFSDKATSNFVIKREKNIVTAAVYGRNEIPNTATDSAIDKTRNALVGTSAIAGVSNAQWKSLANGVLGK